MAMLNIEEKLAKEKAVMAHLQKMLQEKVAAAQAQAQLQQQQDQ